MATNAERQAKWQANRKSYITGLEKEIEDKCDAIDFLLKENKRLEAEIEQLKAELKNRPVVMLDKSPVIEHKQEFPRSPRLSKKSGWGNPGTRVIADD